MKFPWLKWTWVNPNYMERMPLIPRNQWFNVYLHRYANGESLACGLHDHPWHCVSIRLKGWITELKFMSDPRPFPRWATVTTGDGERMIYERAYRTSVSRPVPRVCFRKADEPHAISFTSPGAMTLFITGPYFREWGFWTGAGSEGWQHNSRCKERLNV